MRNFLEEVVEKVCEKHTDLNHVVFVLPSKRAGTFLRNSIAKILRKTIFSPDIYSIESFVEVISGLNYASNTEQIFELYDAYIQTAKKKDSFSIFTQWAQTVLQDFNEIDRYLVPAHQIFSHLSAIQEIDHWYLQDEKTKIMKDYIHFWENLEGLYMTFNARLKEKGLGHQGLVYRQACENLQTYLKKNNDKIYIFIGFNALNTAESQIIQEILKRPESQIYWDIDSCFIDDPIHDAGYFIRQHKNRWPYLNEHPLKGLQDNYQTQKNIQIIGVPKNVSQAKYVGNLLGELQEKDAQILKNTAVVLADETLLNPLLNAIPEQVDTVNITMGYPLHKTTLASLFSHFFNLYLSRTSEGWFYKKVLTLLSHPYIHILLSTKEVNYAVLMNKTIREKNWSYVTMDNIKSLKKEFPEALNLLFFDTGSKPEDLLEKSLGIVLALKTKFISAQNNLELEYAYRFYTIFNELKDLLMRYPFINDVKALYGLYKELLSSETLDFRGEPLQGLQIMGMLESRNLDFETIILTSVNEGILPAGKSTNSSIPFDVKVAFNLPTYKEKDAVYTYHFYRLLQRAKNIYILYNTEPDVLEGGEKSRLIYQLLTDENKLNQIREFVASPEIVAPIKAIKTITKDAHLLDLIRELAANGLSPSSLSNYIRNPIAFYKNNILKIKDPLEVEETVAANTFGTIVHDVLEDLYTPLIGSFLDHNALTAMKSKIESLVEHHFTKSYMDGDISQGKNLIAFHVAMRYVENFIAMEIKNIKTHTIKIIGLEQKVRTEIRVKGIDFPVVLKGKLDRIDEIDGVLRIIDYKTGKVTANQLEIIDWEDITVDYAYSKAFQLLCYVCMYNNTKPIDTVKAGILSFKNLKAGLLQFATKEKKGSSVKNTDIDQKTLVAFKVELEKLILEILNPHIPFTEKEI